MGKTVRWLIRFFGGKKRWRFAKSFREKEKSCHEKPVEDLKVLYSPVIVDEEEQSRRAMAVAEATAAVAEAAVAAARAAAIVVRLTTSGRSVAMKGEERAAVKIQAAFRGYLARRALRALKGLVRLQALVRGNIVRKQAAETLRCMQALVRVQSRARACRALRPEPCRSSKSSRSNPGPATPDKHEASVQRNASKSNRSASLRKTSLKQTESNDSSHSQRDHSASWNWLDQWMEERYWDCIEASKAIDDEKNAKILEVDTGKPLRLAGHNSDQVARSISTVHDSPAAQISIPPPSPANRRRPMSPMPRFPAFDVPESPQFYSAASRPGRSRRGPFTPAKSECSRSLFNGYADYPNYMANTKSSVAKTRSQSAPKQRPELEKARRLSCPGLERPSGSSVASGIGGQRSAAVYSKFESKPGSRRLDRGGGQVRL